MAAFVLSLIIALTPAVQGHPDFSGTWALDVRDSVGLNDDEQERGVTLRVRQTDREVIFERRLNGGDSDRVVTYALDGSERVSKSGSQEVKARSRWDGDRLITTGTQSASILFVRLSATFDEDRHLADNGRTMIAESTFVRDGKTARRRLVFRRQ